MQHPIRHLSFILLYERQYGKNNVPLNRVTRAAILEIYFFF